MTIPGSTPASTLQSLNSWKRISGTKSSHFFSWRGGVADKVVLAYSGGVDTSVAIKWLQEKYNLDVIAFSVDVGNEPDFPAIREKALKLGAVKAVVAHAKKAFGEEFVFPALKANAMYQGQYPLATALARPLMAKLLVETAIKEGAKTVAHGSTGKGNDQVRFDVSVAGVAA